MAGLFLSLILPVAPMLLMLHIRPGYSSPKTI